MNNDQAMSLNVMCTLPMIKEENELNYALRKKIQVSLIGIERFNLINLNLPAKRYISQYILHVKVSTST